MGAAVSARLPGAPARPFRVGLVCMPFYEASRPSIQIGLLGAVAERAGFPTDTHHLNLELAARLGLDVYEALYNHRGRRSGEWLFSVAAFAKQARGDDEAYFAAFQEEIAQLCRSIGKDQAYLSRLRHELLPGFIEDCLAMADWGAYRVVGFSSTFQQNVASLALARRIKQRHPEVVVVFGGANMEDEMGPEYVRAFECIDYAVVGEGDLAFPALLRCLAENQPLEKLAGVVSRSPDGVVRFKGQAPPVRDLDGLPAPDYDEYFERAGRLGLLHHPGYPWFLPFESARGCWWGQKHHCTFCGLNDLGIIYRAKRPERVLRELGELAARYRCTFFEAVDNILDLRYVKELFKVIEETRSDYQFFYEVKANLSREQIGALARGGVRRMQPGIESLSSNVLKLMRKGCSMLQNVRLLKWARYYGIDTGWNLLWGFPGETEQDYRRELEVLKLISHLQPPTSCSRISLDRFAPYFVERERFPVRDVRPEESYRYVYPAGVSLEKVAYFFDYQMDQTLPEEAHQETIAWVEEWRRRWNSEHPDSLFYRRTREGLFIDDDRGPERRGTYAFEGALALIYEFCGETLRSVGQAVEHLECALDGQRLPEEEVRAALEEFCRLGLMLGEEGKYLSLALPANPNW